MLQAVVLFSVSLDSLWLAAIEYFNTNLAAFVEIIRVMRGDYRHTFFLVSHGSPSVMCQKCHIISVL